MDTLTITEYNNTPFELLLATLDLNKNILTVQKTYTAELDAQIWYQLQLQESLGESSKFNAKLRMDDIIYQLTGCFITDVHISDGYFVNDGVVIEAIIKLNSATKVST